MKNREDIQIRDPFVYVEKGSYYLLGTTGNQVWTRGSDLMLYRSKDLESFQEVGCMVEEMVFDRDGGHCMLFEDLDGNTQLSLHQPNVTPMERMKFVPLADL